MPRRPGVGRVKYHRSPGLVLYWSDAGLVCTDCVSGKRFAVNADIVRQLDEAGEVRSTDRRARAMTNQLAAAGLLTKRPPRRWPWTQWMPEAAFFHFGTRAAAFEQDVAARERQLRAKARHTPPPPPTKRLRASAIRLSAAADLGDLARALAERRTWRNFSRRQLKRSDLETLLWLTFGVQRWGAVRGQGKVALKTSPSAGARHPLEAYVLASNVEGFDPGVYHYDAARHALVPVRKGLSARRLAELLAGQRYFADASAAVVMSAVFARAMWKYPSSRAYRAILIDAGHLGQTFCLVATALGLAPFCTMAFREAELDRALGIDGIDESAMYVVGVGPRPRRVKSPPGAINPPRTI